MKDCIDYYFKALPYNKALEDDKNYTIRFFFQALTHQSQIFNEKHKEEFSEYKRVVIAAYLTYSVGFKITKSKLTIGNIYAENKYAIQELKKKK